MTANSTPRQATSTALRSTAFLWIVGPLWYLTTEAITASAFPAYSYATNYISDLGVPEQGVLQDRVLDSPLHAVMNAGFIGEGLLFLLGLVLLLPHLKKGASAATFLALGSLHAVGIILVGLVPGSEANSANGLILWHGLGAVAAIACGNLAAIVAGHAMDAPRVMKRAGQVLGVIGILSAALLLLHFVLPDGIWERVSVYTFIAWQLVTGLSLFRSTRTDVDA